MPETLVQAEPEQKISLDHAIKDAFKTEGEKPENKVVEPEKVESKADKTEKVEPKTADEKEVVEDLPFGLSAEEQLQALQLFRGLKDPTAGRAILKGLGEMAGFELSEKSTKQEIKDVKDELETALAEQFGEDFAKKTAPLLKTLIAKQVEDGTKEIKQSAQETQLEKIKGETEKAYSALAQEFFKADEFPTEVQKEMSKIMDSMKPSSGQSPKDYLKDVYFIAAGRTGVTASATKDKDVKDKKIEKNRNDVPAILASERKPSGLSNGSKTLTDPSRTPQYKSLSESVQAAMEQVAEQMGMNN